MIDQTRDTPERETGKETGAVLLAIGGLAAAFGAASCCALAKTYPPPLVRDR